MLRANINLPAEKVARKYKELWQVEQVFRNMKSALDTRTIFHKLDESQADRQLEPSRAKPTSRTEAIRNSP